MATKLPLAMRKNIKDEFDARKSEYDETLSTIFKEKWSYNFDFPTIWSNAVDGYAKERPGSMATSYVKGLEYQAKRFVEKFGDDGLAGLNAAASTHTVSLELEEGKKISYCSCDIKDGVLRLIYSKGNLAVNVDDAALNLDKAVDEAEKSAGGGGLDFAARASVKEDWDSAAPDLEKELQEMVKMPSLKIIPGFEEAAKSMRDAGKERGREDWEGMIGRVILSYFKALAYNMKNAEFGTDELLQEGFQEGVPSGKIGFRVVPKLVKGNYHECILEDDQLWIQTTPQNWWVNVDDVGRNLIDLF